MIVWGDMENDEGKKVRVPLDPVPAVYRIFAGDEGIALVRDRECAVSHFATCPRADDFSKGADHKKAIVFRCDVAITDGPFKGLKGVAYKNSVKGPDDSTPFSGWWVQVKDESGRVTGLCQVSDQHLVALS